MAESQSVESLTGLRPSLAGRPFHVRLGHGVWRFVRTKPLGALGGVIVVLFLTAGIGAQWIAPYDPNRIDLSHTLEGPSSLYRLGTDDVGHDVLSRLIWGARLSMIVAFGAVFISSVMAGALGISSAYIGGWYDMLISRVVDAWIAMPGLIILITIMGIVRRTDTNLMIALLFALAILRIAPATRVYRSLVLEIRERPYIEAAEAIGSGTLRTMWRHVLPNAFPFMFVAATVALPGTILAEASLSFLGFGPTGETSWGQMLSVDGREFFRKQMGLAIWPGVCIGLSVFGFNMFGDALRDVLDPRLRGQGK